MGLLWGWDHLWKAHRSRRWVFPLTGRLHLTSTQAQLQKYEDTAPDSLEFERLKEHFDSFIRTSTLASSTSGTPGVAHSTTVPHSHHSNSITAAASAALARDIPGVGKYNPLARSTKGSGKDRSINRDEMPEYRSRSEISKSAVGGEYDVELLNSLEEIGDISRLEQRWENSWMTPLQTKYVAWRRRLGRADDLPGNWGRYGFRCTRNDPNGVQLAHISSSSRSRRHNPCDTKSSSLHQTISPASKSFCPTSGKPRMRLRGAISASQLLHKWRNQALACTQGGHMNSSSISRILSTTQSKSAYPSSVFTSRPPSQRKEHRLRRRDVLHLQYHCLRRNLPFLRTRKLGNTRMTRICLGWRTTNWGSARLGWAGWWEVRMERRSQSRLGS